MTNPLAAVSYLNKRDKHATTYVHTFNASRHHTSKHTDGCLSRSRRSFDAAVYMVLLLLSYIYLINETVDTQHVFNIYIPSYHIYEQNHGRMPLSLSLSQIPWRARCTALTPRISSRRSRGRRSTTTCERGWLWEWFGVWFGVWFGLAFWLVVGFGDR